MIRETGYFVLFLITITLGFFAGAVWNSRENVTLVSLSPDDVHRVRLIETNGFIDRNFRLEVENLDDSSNRVIFRSPDEGSPPGSERILWSPDSRRFLLVGRHFYPRDGAPTSGGEIWYLLYDVRSGKLWCNAEYPEHPPFESDQIDWLPSPATMDVLKW